LGRILAVDLGTRRVGLAITDPLRMIASPLRYLPFAGEGPLAQELLRLAAEQDVERAVVGLPLAEDGAETPGCQRARSLARRLQAGGLAAVLWDERYSSREAEEALRQMGVKRRGGRVDPWRRPSSRRITAQRSGKRSTLWAIAGTGGRRAEPAVVGEAGDGPAGSGGRSGDVDHVGFLFIIYPPHAKTTP
jgi:putative Holliday junction resolvase